MIWQQINDGWFQYHYCTNCGFKHFRPEKRLPRKCPQCNEPRNGKRTSEIEKESDI